jgi:hypothetical protein
MFSRKRELIITLDVFDIRTAILDCLERADGGKAVKAALEQRGLMLANGDRRDCFVVVDQAGGQHALNKKLTSQTLAETRRRRAELDRGRLPSVEQAQAMQRTRQAVAQPGPRHPGHAVEITAAVAAAQEGRTRPEPAAASAAPAGLEIAASIPAAAAREPDPVRELAATADAAVDRGAHAGAGALRSLGKLFSGFLNWIADSIVPSPPLTKDQAEREDDNEE